MQQTRSAMKRNRFRAQAVLLGANLILVVPSVPTAMLERQVRERMVFVRNAKQVSIAMRPWVRRPATCVPLDGRLKLAAPSANRARLAATAASEVRRVKVVRSDSIVRVKKKMPMVNLRKKVRIQRHAWIVQQVGRPKQAAPSANRARLGLSAASKRRRVKVVSSDSIVKVKRAMVKVDLQIKLQILRNVLTVRQDGHPRWAALNVKPVELEHTVTAVNHAH